MRGRLLLLPAALALISAAPPAVDPRTINGDWPPARFTRDTAIRVRFVLTQDEMDALCGRVAVAGKVRVGCERRDLGGKYLVLPHPLAIDAINFRLVTAHELGHANGWNATHDN